MAIKVLLLKDVEPQGRSGDLVSVKPGFYRNWLLPQGLAVVASAHALRQQTRLQEERKQKAIADKAEAESLAEKMSGHSVTTTVKVDQEGHMYGSVTAADIAHMMEQQLSIAIEKRFVHLAHPIKEVGVFEVPLRLKEGVTSSVTVKVIAEEHK